MDERRLGACPSFPELIRAFERDLPPDVCATITAHARTCAACQGALVQAESLIQMAGALLAEDSYDEDATRARAERFQEKLHARKQTQIHTQARRPMRRWLSIAAMGPLFVAAALLSRPSATVLHADELIARAVTQARQRTDGATAMQRVRIRLTPAMRTKPSGARYTSFLAVRELENGTNAQAWPAAVAATASASAVAAGGDAPLDRILEAHHFDWRAPLSIERFLAWRASLTDRRDRVSIANDAEFVLRTTTSEGLLREVHLTVDRTSFRVVRQLLVFDGIGSLEIEEIAEWVRRDEPVEVIRVTESATATIESAPVRPTRIALTPTIPTATASPVSLTLWLDRTFGPAATGTKATFVPDVRRLMTDTSRQLNALYALAPRPSDAAIWGEPKEPPAGDLSSGPTDGPHADSAEHAAAVDQRYRELNATLNRLSTRMAVMFGSTSRCEARDRAPSDWSSRTAAGLDRSRKLEQALQNVLAQADIPTDERNPEGSRQASRAFDAVWEAINCGARD